MNKQIREIQLSLERSTGTMNPNITQISKATGHSRDYIRKILFHEKCDHFGNNKRYFSGDVAKVLFTELWN